MTTRRTSVRARGPSPPPRRAAGNPRGKPRTRRTSAAHGASPADATPRGRKATHVHYCPIARSLDLLGDRWTLLVLRELLFGDRRFSDLRAELVGISPTLLSERLQALAATGLVTTRELPPPAARTVYTVTPRGRDTVPILQAMARFGVGLLESPSRGTVVRPEMAVHGAVASWHDPAAAGGVDEVYRLIVDGEPFTLASARGATRSAGEREPALTLTGTARAFVEARRGETTLARAIERGVVQVQGSASALRNFQRAFRLP
ncbi:MAG TPA: winged helix-turn-helix transcriptional regulator [Candidatus Binatia bacterium]|nr:winged helix-turn-helix transcriptional regulator [Candidatus Binatia bacterium]